MEYKVKQWKISTACLEYHSLDWGKETKWNCRAGLSLPGARLTLGTIDKTVISKSKLAYVRV